MSEQVESEQVDDQMNLATLGQFVGAIERRELSRSNYCCPIQVADFKGGPIPPDKDFHDVATRDLSPAGAAYLSNESPEVKHVVFRLGGDLCPIYVAARVVHAHPGYWSASGPQWLIGCEFVG